MMRDHRCAQPLFWAAVAFSLGSVDGGASLAASLLVGDCGCGFCFCGFLVSSDAHGRLRDFARVRGFFWGFSDSGSRAACRVILECSALLLWRMGVPVTLTARVMREGYARASGTRSIRESIDLETEEIASDGASWPVRAGVRLAIYEKVENSAFVERAALPQAPGILPPGLDAADGASGTGETPVAPLALHMARGCGLWPSCIRRAITAIPEPSIMKAICATTASACWGRREAGGY